MRKWVIFMCAGVLALGGIGLRALAAEEAKTVEGELVDTHCYAKNGAKGEGHSKCGGKCAASGIPVAVLVDGKAWTLTTNPKPLADSVGKTVKVTGTPNPDSMMFVPDTVQVKDGDSWKDVKLSDTHHKGGDSEKKEEKKES